MSYPRRPAAMRNIRKPVMMEKQNPDIEGVDVASYKKPMDTKKNMKMTEKSPVNPIKGNIQYFTNDTLLMDTTPGLSGEDRARKTAKRKIGKNLVRGVTVPTEEEMSE